jgi:hypothetical protein
MTLRHVRKMHMRLPEGNASTPDVIVRVRVVRPSVVGLCRGDYSRFIMKKLTLVGAGSAMFTQGLVADALEAGPWEIALVAAR